MTNREGLQSGMLALDDDCAHGNVAKRKFPNRAGMYSVAATMLFDMLSATTPCQSRTQRAPQAHPPRRYRRGSPPVNAVPTSPRDYLAGSVCA
jgi:hypothetical protein